MSEGREFQHWNEDSEHSNGQSKAAGLELEEGGTKLPMLSVYTLAANIIDLRPVVSQEQQVWA